MLWKAIALNMAHGFQLFRKLFLMNKAHLKANEWT